MNGVLLMVAKPVEEARIETPSRHIMLLKKKNSFNVRRKPHLSCCHQLGHTQKPSSPLQARTTTITPLPRPLPNASLFCWMPALSGY